MKSEVAIIFYLIYIISSVNCQLPSTTQSILNQTQCAISGVLVHGLVFRPVPPEHTFDPVNGRCPRGSLLLQPGVIFNGNLIVSKNGTCLLEGTIKSGIVQVIEGNADLVQIGGQLNATDNRTCDDTGDNGVALFEGVVLETFPSGTSPNDVFLLKENPLIDGLNYTTSEPNWWNRSVCMDSGILVDGSVMANLLVNASSNGSCPVSSLKLPIGTIMFQTNDPEEIPTIVTQENLCMVNGRIQIGRLILLSPFVEIGQNVSSGITCPLNAADPTQIVAVNIGKGVDLIFLPATTTTTTTKRYYRDDYYVKPYNYYVKYDDYEYQPKPRRPEPYYRSEYRPYSKHHFGKDDIYSSSSENRRYLSRERGRKIERDYNVNSNRAAPSNIRRNFDKVRDQIESKISNSENKAIHIFNHNENRNSS